MKEALVKGIEAMNRNSVYYKQVQLLIQVLPFVAKQECFALKGGTAINLFVRELPRLSVDIDLVYLPMKSREPDWTLLNLKGVNNLPAIKWKQINLAKMPDDKHKQALEKLKDILDG